MAKTFNRDRTPENVALMIARRKEKQRKLTEARKPQTKAEWEALILDMKEWYQQNDWALDIDDYAVAKGYVPYKINRDWPNENELFKEHIASMYALLKQRHNNLLVKEGKIAQLILKERPLYNPLLAAYEQQLKKDEQAVPNISLHFPPVENTPALAAHMKGKNEKNTLEQ